MTQYEEHWKDWHQAEPTAPFGPHHLEPNPDFVTLCAEAERQDAHVELEISAGLFKTRLGDTYRNVVALLVRPDDRSAEGPRVMVPTVPNDSFRAMAVRAREMLERA